jgi:hypothetical protein
MCRKVIIALLLALFLLPVRGQEPKVTPPPKWPTTPPPLLPQEKPPAIDASDVVRITTNLVQIDTIVTRNDKQVTDLRADDFELLEDGKPPTDHSLLIHLDSPENRLWRESDRPFEQGLKFSAGRSAASGRRRRASNNCCGYR